MKNIIIQILCINLLVSHSFLAFADTVPDNIDYKKYYTIYSQFKQISDQKRHAADQALLTVQESEGDLRQVNSEYSQNATTLANHQTELVQLASDIQKLQSQNGSMSASISQNQTQISQNQGGISVLQSNISVNQGQMQRAQSDRAQADSIYQQALRAKELAETRERSAEQDRAASVQQVRQLEQNVAAKQGQIARNQQQITALEKEISDLQAAIPGLQSQVQTLQSQTTTLQSQVQQRTADVSALREKKQALQVQADRDAQARDKLRAQLTQLNSAISSAQSQLSSLQQTITQANSSIAAKQQELSLAQSSIGPAQNQLRDAVSAKDSLAKELGVARSELSAKNAQKAVNDQRLSELSRQLRILEGRPRPRPTPGPIEPSIKSVQDEDPQIAVIKAEIEKIKLANAILASEIIALQNQISTGDARMTELKNQIDGLNAHIARLQGFINNNPSQISSLQSQVSSAQSQASALSSQISSNQSQQASVSSQLASAESAAQASASTLQAVASELAQKEDNLRHLQGQATASAQQLAQAQTSLAQKQTRVTQANSELSTARSSIGQMNQELDRLNQFLTVAVRTYNQREQAYVQYRRQADDARASLSVAQRNLESVNVIVMGLQDQRRSYDLQLQALVNQNGTLQAANDDLRSRISQNADQIKYDQDMIAWTNNDIQRLNQVNQGLAQNRAILESQISSQQATYSQLDQTASAAEATTAVKFQDYDVRKKRYDTLLAEAISTGTSAGSQVGAADGEPKGKQAGLTQGAQDGQLKGMNEGLEYGFAQGKIAGDKKGYEDGHVAGNASAASLQKGEAEGYLIGKSEAEAEAMRVDYIKGKQDQFIKLTSMLPTQMIQLEQNAAGAVSPNKKSFSAKMPKVFLQIAKPKARECNQTYVDFVNACNGAYQNAYDQSYQRAYQVAYDAAYPGAYEPARKAAFEQYKNTRFDEGYKLAYTPAFQRGLGVGTQEAYQRGIQVGRKKGYDENISAARAAAYAKGVQDTIQYFATHPVLLLKDAKLIRVGLDGSIGGSLGASDLLKLELTVVNFGSKESSTEKIKVEAQNLTSNLSLVQKVVQFVSVPANSVTTVSNVLTAKVLESAAAGSTEKLSVKFTDEEGNLTEKVLTAQVLPTLQAKYTRVDYNQTPKIGKTQNMKVFVNNYGNFSPAEKMTLVLSTDAPADVLKINKSQVEILKLPVGTTYSIPGLSYTLLKAAPSVKMVLSLKHGTRVVFKQELVLNP